MNDPSMHPHYLKKVANRQMFKAYYFNIQTSRYMHEKKIRNSSFRTHEKIAKKTFKFNAESVIPTFFSSIHKSCFRNYT